ncbi:hypothetical protein Cgig2_020778 [Carnegiea gigantea]|uniref:SWIM-type domain-containing protein n=1 Tax=Carnegiea gigantea TaxID=171969 RepID=A0A9Q1Q6Z0_9CARY|nr:hypothetical protein Cgig2_020778 [Carnegiea gigantea]
MLPGGRKDCVLVKENMNVLEVLRIVKEAMREGIKCRRMWYSLKHNRLELLPLGQGGDVKKLMKGNDEYTYLYVAGSEGPCVGGVHGNEACEEQWRGVAVLTVEGVGDAMQGNTGEREEVDEATVIEEHMKKLGLKVNKRKTELEKWKNDVGDRIENKLRETLGNIGSIADVKLFNVALGKYGVLLTNNHSLVVNLAERKCSCKWWQLKGLPCAHAMAVIEQKLRVHDYVSDCYKLGSQNTIYMNSIHPMEMHDSTTVDNARGLVVGGKALDDRYNRRILLPLNSHPQGKPRKWRIES